MTIAVVYLILFILFVCASAVDARAHKHREKLEDEICRIQLGKKYYEELYGRGSWNSKSK
jgi:hypothetical protein